MAHAGFRGTPTYFAVFKIMISSKNVNQNMLKNSLIFFEKNLKNPPSSGGFASRSQLASGGWVFCTHPPPCDLTHTYFTATKRSKFVALFNEGFKGKILVKTFFWRTHYTFGTFFGKHVLNIWADSLRHPNCFVLLLLWFSHIS